MVKQLVNYEIMSLFDAPEDAVIVHACNSVGVWGAGIAAQFRKSYPHSFKEYKLFCEINKNKTGIAGLSSLHTDEKHQVGWIITSHLYGEMKDDIEVIKAQTTLALEDFLKRVEEQHSLHQYPQINVYSNKFNSGLFDVPWLDSETILNVVLARHPRINWIVCVQE